jgi:hypothetical protein
VLPLITDDEDDETASQRSLGRSNLSSAAEWVIEHGDRQITTEDIERQARAVEEAKHDALFEQMKRIREGIDRTDIA